MPPTPLRKRLTNEDKMKIIEESKQPGFCRKKTMDKYGISRSAISVILLKQKEFLKTMDSSPIAMKSKNIRACQNAKMERKLYDWICMKQKIGVPLSGQIIMEKTVQIVTRLVQLLFWIKYVYQLPWFYSHLFVF